MPHPPLRALAVVLAIVLPTAATAQPLQARDDLTLSDLRRTADEMAPGGWVPEDVVVSGAGGSPRFSARWRWEPGVAWEVRYHLSGAELQAALDDLTPLGYVPTRIAGYEDRGTPRFVVIWRRERDATWEARFGLRGTELEGRIAAWRERGYRPRSITAYPFRGDVRYAAVWRPDGATAAPDARPAGRAVELPIAPVVQRTRVWCWLAVGEMVFRHLGVPDLDPAGDFQCGIIGGISGPGSRCAANCYACIRPSGSNAAILAMLADYARLAAGRALHFREGRVASPLEVMESVDAGRPLIAGSSYARKRVERDVEHVALIVGYEVAERGLYLIVNDPFPYAADDNPFLLHGGAELRPRQYRIPYETFRDQLHWHWTVYDFALA